MTDEPLSNSVLTDTYTYIYFCSNLEQNHKTFFFDQDGVTDQTEQCVCNDSLLTLGNRQSITGLRKKETNNVSQ